MGAAVRVTRSDLDPASLRRAARRTRDVAASRRMLAPALVLEGTSRTGAAQATGMDRQALRDRVHRFNEQGLAGLSDRTGNAGAKPFLSREQEAQVAEGARSGPDLAEHGVVRWRRADLARVIKARFGVVLAGRSVGAVLRRLASDRREAARAQQHHAATPAALRPRAEPGRERLGLPARQQALQPRARNPRRHRRCLL